MNTGLKVIADRLSLHRVTCGDLVAVSSGRASGSTLGAPRRVLGTDLPRAIAASVGYQRGGLNPAAALSGLAAAVLGSLGGRSSVRFAVSRGSGRWPPWQFCAGFAEVPADEIHDQRGPTARAYSGFQTGPEIVRDPDLFGRCVSLRRHHRSLPSVATGRILSDRLPVATDVLVCSYTT
jgi:hypothetical protein